MLNTCYKYNKAIQENLQYQPIINRQLQFTCVMGNCLEYLQLLRSGQQEDLPQESPSVKLNLNTDTLEKPEANNQNPSKIRNIQTSLRSNLSKQQNVDSNSNQVGLLSPVAFSGQLKEESQKNHLQDAISLRNTSLTTKSDNYMKYPKQLQPKRQEFLNSYRLNHVLKQSSNIQEMLQAAAEAYNLFLFPQSKNIYIRSLTKVQPLKNQYSKQSIQEMKAYIYCQLSNIAIIEQNEIQGDTFLLRALQSYKMSILSSTIQEQIALLNNYGIFKRNCGKFQEAKKYMLEAMDLIDKYYTVEDDRRFLSLINLECLYFESSQPQQAHKIIEKINTQCKNSQIIALADRNKLAYSA